MAYHTNKVAIEKRRESVMELLLTGLSERAIADRLGVSNSLVHQDKVRVLEDMRENNSNIAEDVRNKQIARYDKLLSKWWPLITDPDVEPNSETSYVILKILDGINRLHGVVPDKPLINIDARTIESMTRTVVLTGEQSSALGHKRLAQSSDIIKNQVELEKPTT